jgi:hypothetical protein
MRWQSFSEKFVITFLMVVALAGAHAASLATTPSPSVPSLEQRWVGNTSGPFYTGTADVEPGGSFYVEPYYFDYRTRGSHTVNAPFKVALGIGKKFEFDVYAPLVFVRNANPNLNDPEHASNSGYGDTILQVKWQATKEEDRTHFLSRPSTGLVFAENVPTGKFQGLQQNLFGSDQLGTGEWNEQFGLLARKQFRPFELYVQEGAVVENPVTVTGPYSFDNGIASVPAGEKYRVVDGTILSSSAALEHVLSPKHGFGYLVEYIAERQFSHNLLFGRATTPTYSYINLIPEVEITGPHKGKFEVTWGAGTAFTVRRKNYPAQLTPMFTITLLADLHGSR